MSSSKRIKLALSRLLAKCPNKRCPSNINKTVGQQSIVVEHNSFQHTIKCNSCYEQWTICLPCKKRFLSSKNLDASLHFPSQHNIAFVNDACGSVDNEPVSPVHRNAFTTDNDIFETPFEVNNITDDGFYPTRPASTAAASFDPTDKPRKIVTIFIKEFCATSLNLSTTKDSFIRFPRQSIPNRGAALGSNNPTSKKSIIGNTIFSF